MLGLAATVLVLVGIFSPSIAQAQTVTPIPRSINVEKLRLLEEKKEEWEELRVQKREELQERLRVVQDERKQRVTENLDDRIVFINNKWVTHWNSVLARLSEILTKIEARTGETNETVAAKVAIATAQAAVDEQAGKLYEFEIDTEATLGENVRKALSEFHVDLRAVQTLVGDAREAVFGSLRALKTMESEDSSE